MTSHENFNDEMGNTFKTFLTRACHDDLPGLGPLDLDPLQLLPSKFHEALEIHARLGKYSRFQDTSYHW